MESGCRFTRDGSDLTPTAKPQDFVQNVNNRHVKHVKFKLQQFLFYEFFFLNDVLDLFLPIFNPF